MRARRLRRALAALLAVAGLFVPFIVGVPTAYDGEPVFVAIPVEHVNTLIGTGTGAAIVGEINNFPGASVPFGMVQYSPDTVDNYAGYDYGNPHSTGFSMTHASVGCPAFGDISMLPTTTPLGSQPWSAWEEIAHDDTEVGVPGYYTVRFPGTGVIAELTATTRTGVGRFRYPRNGWPALFHVRSGASLAGNYAATLQIEDNTTITGSATSGGFCGKKNLYTVYFAMKFSQPFSSYGTWDGYAVYPGSHSMNSSYSGGVCRVSGRLGARGADRPVLCERGRGASQPGRRRRSKLRRHPCGDIERMERRAIANRGGRQGAWRRGHLLHLSLPVTVAPQHL